MAISTRLRQVNRGEWRRYKLIIFLTCCLTAAWLLFSSHGALRYYNLRKQINIVKKENQRLKEENANIRLELDRLKNDPAYLEEVARKKFGLIKKNEIIFELNGPGHK